MKGVRSAMIKSGNPGAWVINGDPIWEKQEPDSICAPLRGGAMIDAVVGLAKKLFQSAPPCAGGDEA